MAPVTIFISLMLLLGCGKMRATALQRVGADDVHDMSLAGPTAVLYGVVKSSINNMSLTDIKFMVDGAETQAARINKNGTYRLDLPIAKQKGPKDVNVCATATNTKPNCAIIKVSQRSRFIPKNFILERATGAVAKPGYRLVTYTFTVNDSDYPSGDAPYNIGVLTITQNQTKICQGQIPSLGKAFQMVCEIPLNKNLTLCASQPDFLTECIVRKSGSERQSVTFQITGSN